MGEFERVYHSNAPHQLPVILKVLNMDQLFHYMSVARRLHGEMENGRNGSRWYYARGFFFFASENDAREFSLASRLVHVETDPNWFNGVYSRITGAFV